MAVMQYAAACCDSTACFDMIEGLVPFTLPCKSHIKTMQHQLGMCSVDACAVWMHVCICATALETWGLLWRLFKRACLGGLSLASTSGAFWGTTQVEVNCSHESAIAPISKRCDHQPGAVTQVFIPILHLCIHHTHWDGQCLRVIV